MKVRTTTRDTIVTGDGYVSRTTTTITTVHVTEIADDAQADAGSVAAGVDAGAASGMATSATAQETRARETEAGQTGAAMACGESDCFDFSGCDEVERRLIAALRAYLRPACAPAPLMARLHECLDRAEDEECRGCGK